jgi:hypothetical protein
MRRTLDLRKPQRIDHLTAYRAQEEAFLAAPLLDQALADELSGFFL